MKFSRGFKVCLLVTLVVTVSLKTVVRDTVRAKPWDEAQEHILAFFARHGFQARAEQRPAGLFFHATSKDCRLLVGEMAPQGLNRDSINRFAREIGRLVFVFDGVMYPEQPVALTSLDHYWTRFRQRIGLTVDWRPIYAVAASDTCSLEALPWTEIAKFR